MISPDRLLARLVRHGGGRLLHRAIDRALPAAPSQEKVKRNLLAGIAGAVAMRVATRSVPGAIIVTSGIVAKKLFERRKARRDKAAATGQNTTPNT